MHDPVSEFPRIVALGSSVDNNPPSSVSTWEFGLFRHKQAVSGAPAVGGTARAQL